MTASTGSEETPNVPVGEISSFFWNRFWWFGSWGVIEAVFHSSFYQIGFALIRVLETHSPFTHFPWLFWFTYPLPPYCKEKPPREWQVTHIPRVWRITAQPPLAVCLLHAKLFPWARGRPSWQSPFADEETEAEGKLPASVSTKPDEALKLLSASARVSIQEQRLRDAVGQAWCALGGSDGGSRPCWALPCRQVS